MIWGFICGIWCLFVGINISIAEWNDSVRRKRIKNGNTKQIEHFWYGLGYGILCGAIFYISRNWAEFFSLLLLHLGVFPPAYNRFSDLPMFNLSKTSRAITDRIMVAMKLKSTEEVNIIAFCISVILMVVQLVTHG